MTALIVAVKGGYTNVVKELLKRNPNVNMTEKDGNTALMIAAIEGHTEIVQDLLDMGTYVNIPDRVRRVGLDVHTHTHTYTLINRRHIKKLEGESECGSNKLSRDRSLILIHMRKRD